MSLLNSAVQRSTLGLHTLEQYEPLIGAATLERIAVKADRVRTMRVAHISSTFYGGGVTELLTPLTLMMNATGIETDWHLIQGTPGFFGCTKKLHNTLQGERLEFSDAEKTIYEQVVFENATRLHLDDCDAIIVHDPQPLPLITHFPDLEMPWFWQCHVDLRHTLRYGRICASSSSNITPLSSRYPNTVRIFTSTSSSSPRRSIRSLRRTGSYRTGRYGNSSATIKSRPIVHW
jgi:hypothetical protein